MTVTETAPGHSLAEQAPGETEPLSEGALPAEAESDDLVESELLVEEISIDGMCGVY